MSETIKTLWLQTKEGVSVLRDADGKYTVENAGFSVGVEVREGEHSSATWTP
jgi:hypothetical protein